MERDTPAESEKEKPFSLEKLLFLLEGSLVTVSIFALLS